MGNRNRYRNDTNQRPRNQCRLLHRLRLQSNAPNKHIRPTKPFRPQPRSSLHIPRTMHRIRTLQQHHQLKIPIFLRLRQHRLQLPIRHKNNILKNTFNLIIKKLQKTLANQNNFCNFAPEFAQRSLSSSTNRLLAPSPPRLTN